MRRQSFRGSLLGVAAIATTMGFATPGFADHTLSSSPTDLQARPSPLGVSGGSQTFLQIKALLYCYAGTLGALVQDSNGQYVLSNNHVLAKENELLNSGGADKTIIQPGLLDEGTCSIDSGNPDNAVATLTDYVQILFGKGRNKPENTVDAAIAAIDAGAVDPSGTILGIGTVNGTASDAVNLPVQKTGRTTAHTFGKVDAVDVTVDVSYESGTARFVGQMRIRRPCGDAGFSDAGDSGSLIVTVPDSGADPQAVGLLFAGSDTDTFANPIQPVLDGLGVTMVAGSDGVDNEGAMLSDYQPIADACPTGGGSGGGGGKGGGPGGRGPHLAAGGPLGLDVAKAVKARHSDEIMALPDVVGHGIGTDENGNAVIEIYVSSKARRAAGRPFPSEFEGIPVRVIETGPVRPF